METNLCVEKAIHREPTRLEINAEEAGQKQIRLPRLDRDARRNAPAVEIPGACVNIVLRHDASVRHRARLAFDGRDAVHKLQRRIRQPHACREGIYFSEGRAECIANLPDGELEALLACEGAGHCAGGLQPPSLSCVGANRRRLQTAGTGHRRFAIRVAGVAFSLTPALSRWERVRVRENGAENLRPAFAPRCPRHQIQLRLHRLRQRPEDAFRERQISLVRLQRRRLSLRHRGEQLGFKRVGRERACECGHIRGYTTAFPLTPALPRRERERRTPRRAETGRVRTRERRPDILPLLWGVGWGERGRVRLQPVRPSLRLRFGSIFAPQLRHQDGCTADGYEHLLSLRFWRSFLFCRAVERLHVHRQALCPQRPNHPQHFQQRLLRRHAERTGEVRLAFKDLANHPRA